MADQAEVAGFRVVRLASASVGSAPTDGAAGTVPQLTMSPIARGGMPCTGLAVMLKAPSSGSATAGAGGFTVTPYMRDPVSYRWGSMESFSAAYGQLFTSFAFNPGELYFQIANVSGAGDIDLHYAEQ